MWRFERAIPPAPVAQPIRLRPLSPHATSTGYATASNAAAASILTPVAIVSAAVLIAILALSGVGIDGTRDVRAGEGGIPESAERPHADG